MLELQLQLKGQIIVKIRYVGGGGNDVGEMGREKNHGKGKALCLRNCTMENNNNNKDYF